MSPDARTVTTFVARARSRARRRVWLEAAGVAAIVGAVVFMAAAVAWFRPARLAFAGVAMATVFGGWSVWRRSASAADGVVRVLEHATPAFRNLLVTATELDAFPDRAKPWVRERIVAQTARICGDADVRGAFPLGGAWRVVAIALGVWLIALAVDRVPLRAGVRQGPAGEAGSARPTAGALRVVVAVTPPAYTGQAARSILDPTEVESIEGSEIVFTVEAPAGRATLEHDGAAVPMVEQAPGRFIGGVRLARTGYAIVDAGPVARRTIPLVAVPDALPSVTIESPGHDLVFGRGGGQRVAFTVKASDDLALRSLALRYTRVSGSGEQFEFREGDIPLALQKASGREWRGDAARTLAELGMSEGDMVVYHAVASDARPGEGTASSDTYFIEISKLGVAAGEGFTLPETETKYALSEQMLVLRTERLQAKRATLPGAVATDEAFGLAAEQRAIRAELVFMLGGEVEDEEAEAEQSTELQEGRMGNSGQRDLRAATRAMSTAGRALTAEDLAAALAAEKAAVKALERAFARDRYILRALPGRTELDATRRLTGDLAKASDWVRIVPPRPIDRRLVGLQDLVSGLGGLTTAASADRTADARQAYVLAAEALRIDAASPVLRQAAADLQRAGDEWTRTDALAKNRTLAAIATAVAGEARKAMADASWPAFGSSSPLAGAFADALRQR